MHDRRKIVLTPLWRRQRICVQGRSAVKVAPNWGWSIINVDGGCRQLRHRLRWVTRMRQRGEGLGSLQTISRRRGADVPVAGQGEARLAHIGHRLRRDPWGDGRAVGRTTTPVTDGEAANAVKLLDDGRILGTLHRGMTRVAVVEAVVDAQVWGVAAYGGDVRVLRRTSPVRAEVLTTPLLARQQGRLGAERSVPRMSARRNAELVLVERRRVVRGGRLGLQQVRRRGAVVSLG